jgi:hypothetical protein
MPKINQNGGVMFIVLVIILTGIALGQFYITHPQIFKSRASTESDPLSGEPMDTEYTPEPTKAHYILIATPTPPPKPLQIPTPTPSPKAKATALPKPITSVAPVPYNTPYPQLEYQYSSGATPDTSYEDTYTVPAPNTLVPNTSAINSDTFPTIVPNNPAVTPATPYPYDATLPVAPRTNPTYGMPVQPETNTSQGTSFFGEVKRYIFGQ